MAPFLTRNALAGNAQQPAAKGEWWNSIRRHDPRFNQVDQELNNSMPGYVFNGVLGTEQPYSIEGSRSRVVHPDERPWRHLPREMWENGLADPAEPVDAWPYGMAP